MESKRSGGPMSPSEQGPEAEPRWRSGGCRAPRSYRYVQCNIMPIKLVSVHYLFVFNCQNMHLN